MENRIAHSRMLAWISKPKSIQFQRQLSSKIVERERHTMIETWKSLGTMLLVTVSLLAGAIIGSAYIQASYNRYTVTQAPDGAAVFVIDKKTGIVTANTLSRDKDGKLVLEFAKRSVFDFE